MLPFELPPVAGCAISPKWDGRNFVFGDFKTPVLEYSENFTGWSDDLTKLHEEAVGNEHPIDLASRNDALEQVKKYMPYAKAVIAEIGCSSGFLIRDLKNTFPEAVIIGSDVVKEPLYQLSRDLPGVPLIRFDLLQCPLPNGCVDILIMLNVLEQIEDDLKALRKAFDLLKPGGHMIIEVPAGPSLYGAYDKELHHFRRYSASELQYKLNKAGFKVCRKSHLGFMLFPGFAIVKLLNKYFNNKKNKKVVHNQAKNTSANSLVKIALSFERKYLSNLNLPFGIRVLAVASKVGY